MFSLLLRRLVLGLLSVMLVFPATALHVCRCARSASAVSQPVAEAALRPCCAKRLAAARQRTPSSEPAIRAKCCCDELRWNQTITQAPPTRTLLPSLSAEMPSLDIHIAAMRPEFRGIRQVAAVHLAPDDPVRITLGRWQI